MADATSSTYLLSLYWSEKQSELGVLSDDGIPLSLQSRSLSIDFGHCQL
jgi:hypothetical protein